MYYDFLTGLYALYTVLNFEGLYMQYSLPVLVSRWFLNSQTKCESGRTTERKIFLDWPFKLLIWPRMLACLR
jgi:hypothetical protein